MKSPGYFLDGMDDKIIVAGLVGGKTHEVVSLGIGKDLSMSIVDAWN